MHKALRAAMLAALVAPCLAAAAGSSGIYPRDANHWTQIPHVDGVSVQVGVFGRWESFRNPKLRPRRCAVPADVFAFGPEETPSAEGLAAHILTTAPLPTSPDWYVFGPDSENVTLQLKVKDANDRVGALVVQPLGSAEPKVKSYEKRGSVLAADIRIPWEQPYYRVDGISRNGTRIFRIVVGTGRPDTYAVFKASRYYSPALPARYESPKGRVGDPYESGPEDLIRDSSLAARVARFAIHGKNDRNFEFSVFEDPDARILWRRRHTGGSRASRPLFSNDILGMQQIWDSMQEESRENADSPIKPISLPPQSTATAAWSFKIIGTRTAYLQVPYTVAKQPGLLARIQSAVDQPDGFPSAKTLGSALLSHYADWLGNQGKGSGLKREMVSVGNEVGRVDVFDEKTELKDVAPILEATTIQLKAEPADVGLAGREVTATVEIDPADQLGVPAGFERGRTVRFDCRGQARIDLPKGHTWRLVGARESVQFSNYVGGERVEARLGQIAYPDLVVYTFGAKGGKPANVRLYGKDGGAVRSLKLSRRDADGNYSAVFANVPPGRYVVRCWAFGRPPVIAEVDVPLTELNTRALVNLDVHQTPPKEPATDGSTM